MAGIMLPSLQREAGTKAQHGSKAKNPHPSHNFAELFKAKSQTTTEARKNNQPARTAPAEGHNQESGKRKAAVESLVVATPFCVTPQTPSPQVLGGERSTAVAAAVKSGVHPKTSQHVLDSFMDQKNSPLQGLRPGITSEPMRMLDKQSGVRPGEHNSTKVAGEPVRPAIKAEALVSVSPAVVPAPVQAQAPQMNIQIVPTQPTGPAAQVAGMIIRAAQDGSAQAELILHPESLGTVQVQLQVDPSGALQALVVADQAATQALVHEIDSLRQTLEAAGLQISDLQMQTRDASQQGNQGASKQDTGTSATLRISNDPAGQPVSTQPLHALIQGGAQLDLQI